MTGEFSDFLKKKGAVELFCALDPLGTRYTDLDERIPIARSTLSVRLDEAEELGLITQLPSTQSQYREQDYILTNRGEQIRERAADLGLPGLYSALRNIQHEFDGGVEAFIEKINEEEDEILEYPPRFTGNDPNPDD